jgi:hypothetical protein
MARKVGVGGYSCEINRTWVPFMVHMTGFQGWVDSRSINGTPA